MRPQVLNYFFYHFPFYAGGRQWGGGMRVTAPEVCLFIVFYSISVVNVFSLILSLVRLAYFGFPGRLIGFSKRGCFKNPVTDSDLKWLIALCCTHDTKIMLYVNYLSIHTYI